MDDMIAFGSKPITVAASIISHFFIQLKFNAVRMTSFKSTQRVDTRLKKRGRAIYE